MKNISGKVFLLLAGCSWLFPLWAISGELLLKTNPLIFSSYRQKKLQIFLRVENKTQQEVSFTAEPVITDCRTGQVLPDSQPVSLKIAGNFDGEISFSLPAKNLKPWSHWDAQLYFLDLTLKPETGPQIKADRVRFGYREVWTEKGNIYINGKKVFLIGGNHSGRRNETEMKFAKLAGFNADTIRGDLASPENQRVLDLADRWGHYLILSLAPVNFEDRFWLYLHGNHPSLIGCAISSPEPVYMLGPHGHPMGIGAVIPEEDKNKPPLEFIRRLHEIDPGRIYGYYVVGLGGHFRSLMWDLGWGVPIQSQKEWLSYWGKNREKVEPFFPQEFALARLGANMVRMDRKFGASAIVEQMARYSGDQAYYRFDKESMAESYAPDAHQVWTKKGLQNEPSSPFFYQVKDFLYTSVFPFWRVWGLAGALLHVDGHPQNLVTDNQPSPLARTMAKISAELYFFLAGPEEDFVSCDHNFYSGETINKSAIVINDSPDAVSISVCWSVQEEKGNTLFSESKNLSVGQGKVGFLPLSWKAPVVKEKRKFQLTATWKDPSGKTHQAQPLQFAVHPAENFVWNQGQVCLIDASGTTREILQKMKIPVLLLSEENQQENLSLLNRSKLLIIGRQSYPCAVKILKPEEITRKVKEGLNIVVLEQLNRHIMGLKLENTGSRETFIRAPDSPLFTGLENDDFSSWQGESGLLPSYPSFDTESLWWYASYSYQGQMNAWRQRRAWHWSNKGTVASFAFEKPQAGNFRVLLDNGFDLLYTPLLELQAGKGRILLSQLDLTDRYGKDPVATVVFQRIIQEYSQTKAQEKSPVGVLTEQASKTLENFHLETRKGLTGRVVFLLPEDWEKLTDQQTKLLHQFLKDGGNVLTSFASPEQAARLPVKVTWEKRELYNPDLPCHGVFSGVGPGEVFLREKHEFLALTSMEGKQVKISSSGLAGISQEGKGFLVILQVPVDKGKSCPDSWSRPKVRRLYATVLSNLGGKSKVEPDWAALGGWGIVEEWLPGYAERVPKKAPKVKESAFYPETGLDWDPDAHVAF